VDARKDVDMQMNVGKYKTYSGSAIEYVLAIANSAGADLHGVTVINGGACSVSGYALNEIGEPGKYFVTVVVPDDKYATLLNQLPNAKISISKLGDAVRSFTSSSVALATRAVRRRRVSSRPQPRA